MPYVVELEPDVFIAPWHGDPGRTLVLNSAKVFGYPGYARAALRAARKYGYAFADAKVVPVEIEVRRKES